MELSQTTRLDLCFALHLLQQEIPFGLVPNFSEEAQPHVGKYIHELSEEDAQILLKDMQEQRVRFFQQETARYEAESHAEVICNDCDCCTEDEKE